MTEYNEHDLFSIFLQDAARHPLLTKEQEFALSRRIHGGDEQALQTLSTSNLRLVVSIARRYQGNGVGLPDMCQEGCLGLMRAARLFNWQKGFRFSTYASNWITQSIQKSLAYDSRMIRLPDNVHDQVQRLSRVRREFEQLHGRTPTLTEVASHAHLPLARVQFLDDINQKCVRLDAPVTDDGRTLHDVAVFEPNERADIQLPDSLVQGIAELSDIERGVITGRYGLDSEHRSLNSLAEEFAVTKQAIRSAEQRALKRLRRVSS